jgi:transcriptional regulator with XRE-family HTH domain
MQLAQNIKTLRHQSGISQQTLAEAVGIARSTLAEYERGKTEPNIDTLIKLAAYFKVSLDQLICKNLLHESYEIIKNKDLRVLAITVDGDNRSNIELVDTKAEAGYLESAQDPEYIRDLPKIWFPSIPEGTYRGFEIRGDSMLPMESGSIVICAYVERLDSIKDNRTYVVVSQREGVVYKRVRVNRPRKTLTLISDNEVYAPYEIHFSEVGEIWQYYAHLSFSDAKTLVDNLIEEKLNDIQQKVNAIYVQQLK